MKRNKKPLNKAKIYSYYFY